jgi:hypothetical protein
MKRRPKPRAPGGTLLHRHGLLREQCVCVGAMSDAHGRAQLRVSKTDLERLRSRELGQLPGPVVALFSTGRASEAVSLDVGETVFVQLPSELAAGAEGLRWRTLVVVAHSAYTGGMHVSGIIHRALVWLEWE